MSKHARQRGVRIAAWFTGVIALGGVAFLAFDFVYEQRAAAEYEARRTALRAEMKKSAAAAPRLDQEYKQQTDRTLRFDRVRGIVAWSLVGVASLFVVCAKWLVSHRPQRAFVPVRMRNRLTVRTDRARDRSPDAAPTPSIPTDAQPAQSTGDHAPPPARDPPPHADDASPRPQWVTLGHPAAKRAAKPFAAHESVDLSPIEGIVQRVGTDREAAIPLLQAIQAHYRYLPRAALRRVCEISAVTPAQIAALATFYAHFRHHPVGEHIVKVCHGTACHVAGARQLSDELRRRLNIATDRDTDPEKRFTIEEVACLGCCSLAPVLMLDQTTCGRLTPATACAALESATTSAHPLAEVRA